ncbi:MAG: pseudouridine synthase [Mycoplasmoidaceae bacterium]
MTKIKVSSENNGIKISTFIKKYCPDKSISAIKKLINKGMVKVNRENIFDNYVLKTFDEIIIYLNIKIVNQKFKKTLMNAKIFYEDHNVLIIDKNKGVLCHEDKHERLNTLNNYLKMRIFQKGYWDGINNENEPALVNRIDKNTSGLVLCAVNKNILKMIFEEQEKNNIKKVYLAVVHGNFNEKKIIFKAFIEQIDQNKMMVSKTKNNINKPIVTQIELITKNQNFSLLKITVLSAKKHQIRAHLTYIGYPIVGDYKYVNKKYFSPYKSQILISNEFIFNFEEGHQLNYLNALVFQKIPYGELKLEPFIEKYYEKSN